MSIFFSADLHLGHSNIIRYCKRPFATHEAMDMKILQNFQEVLRPGDLLYLLGDLAWSSYNFKGFLDQLPTREVHVVWGNHDKARRREALPFRSEAELRSITVGGQQVVLCHYAMRSWVGKGRGAFQLYGHSHGTLPGEGRQLDVGVDTNGFYPWAWEDIKRKLGGIPFNVYD